MIDMATPAPVEVDLNVDSEDEDEDFHQQKDLEYVYGDPSP